MSQFEYLSVLVSIIVGLGVSHLLSSAARLIQVRKRVRLYGPTMLWMASLLLVQIQVWWVAFERDDTKEYQFFLFLLYLAIPVSVALLSYLIVPDLDEPAGIDLRTSYHENRPWLYGILAVAVIVSLLEDTIVSGGVPTDLDALFRIAFLAVAVVGWAFRGERLHYVISASLLASFVLYILLLFLRLG